MRSPGKGELKHDPTGAQALKGFERLIRRQATPQSAHNIWGANGLGLAFGNPSGHRQHMLVLVERLRTRGQGVVDVVRPLIHHPDIIVRDPYFS